MAARNLSKLVPHTTAQLQRLTRIKPVSPSLANQADAFAIPMVFFVSAAQQKAIEKALSRAHVHAELKTRAAKRAAALVHIASRFVESVDRDTPQPPKQGETPRCHVERSAPPPCHVERSEAESRHLRPKGRAARPVPDFSIPARRRRASSRNDKGR
jgi:hypothetical protein